MSLGFFVAIAMAAGAGSSTDRLEAAAQQIDALKQELAIGRSHGTSDAKASAQQCLNFPLPTTPVGPRWTKRYTRYGKSADVTVWRQPCEDGTSFVLVTLKPVGGPAWICKPDAVIQGGVQFSDVSYQQAVNGFDTICGDIFVPVTGWLKARSPDGFDPDKSFTLISTHFTGDQRLAVPAFKPSDYDLAPPPAKITKDYSGSWFTASDEIKNQGWALVFNEELKMAVAYWFTGSTDGESLEWFTVVGSYEGDTAEMDIYKTRDVTFVGATGSTSPFGKFTIEFESCSRGVATYDMADGRKGSLPIERLIPAPEGCN